MNVAFDYAKIARQLDAAQRALKNKTKKRWVKKLAKVYASLAEGKEVDARQHLFGFEHMAGNDFPHHKWDKYSGAEMPHPFNKPHLENLYWQASIRFYGAKEGGPKKRLGKPREPGRLFE